MAVRLRAAVEVENLIASFARGVCNRMHHFRAIKLLNHIVVISCPIFACRMCGNGNSTLTMDFADRFRCGLSPGNAFLQPDGDDMKARGCNLFAYQNCGTADQL